MCIIYIVIVYLKQKTKRGNTWEMTQWPRCIFPFLGVPSASLSFCLFSVLSIKGPFTPTRGSLKKHKYLCDLTLRLHKKIEFSLKVKAALFWKKKKDPQGGFFFLTPSCPEFYKC